jgi:hypothetical protein
MAKIKITKRSVEALKVASKDYFAFDRDLPGFGVRDAEREAVLPGAISTSWPDGRVMIGQFGVVTAAPW